MRKLLIVVALVTFAVTPGLVMGDSFYNSGTYIGIFDGNDSNQWALLQVWLKANDNSFLGTLIEYDKFDAEDTTSSNNLLSVTFEQTIEGDTYFEGAYVDDLGEGLSPQPEEGDDNFSLLYGGTWTTTNATNYYGLKAGDQVAMFRVNPVATSGTWSTLSLDANGTPFFSTFLNNGSPIELSHFTASISTTPVPEPATMLLFGTGLIGLAGIRLRKKNN